MAIKAGWDNALPDYTAYVDQLSRESVNYYLADGDISVRHAVQFDSDSDVIIAAASGTSSNFLGIAADNTQRNTTYGYELDWDTAYAAGQLVAVIERGLCVATSDGTTTLAETQIVSSTAGQLTDGTTAGAVVGRARMTESPAGAGGFFVLEIGGA